MPCVCRKKIFQTMIIIDRKTHTKHDNTTKFMYKYGQNKRTKGKGKINSGEVMIKSCTLIERINSLTVPSGVANCRNLPFGGRATRGSQVRLPRKENMRSRPKMDHFPPILSFLPISFQNIAKPYRLRRDWC